jgi:hypothetical protein
LNFQRCQRVGLFPGLHKYQSMKNASAFFSLQAFLAALFLIVGVAVATSGGYGIGLVIVTVMADGPGLVFLLSAATAMHLRP